jgi:Ni/Co efflux regulator RcnB
MRKLLISILLAGAAASPAIAGPGDWGRQQRDDHQQVHQERAQVHEERAQARSDARAERPSFAGQAAARQQFADRPQFAPRGGQGQMPQAFVRGERFDGRGNAGVRLEAQGGEDAAPGPRMVTAPRQSMRGERFQGRDFRQSDRPMPNVMRQRNPLMVGETPREGTQPPLRVEGRRGGDVHWNRDWRNDNRYDWRRFRDHHRSRFHLGLYIDPFGWGYQSFGIGYRLWPAYYGNQYWIDPALYGLPYPPPGCAWIRYWNDALLINTFTGEVVDEIPNFFW